MIKKFTEYLEKSEPVTEAFQLDRDTHTRMIGLATTKDLEQFFKLAKSLKTELKDEGFDGADVVKFLQSLIIKNRIDY